jgi:hypothetical protein
MKALISSIAIITLVLALSVINMCFVTSFADEMIEIIEKTPQTTALFSRDSMADFFDRWEEKRELIALSVNFDYINDAERAAHEMYFCGLSDGDSDYLDAKAQLISSLRVICDVETFSFYNNI